MYKFYWSNLHKSQPGQNQKNQESETKNPEIPVRKGVSVKVVNFSSEVSTESSGNTRVNGSRKVLLKLRKISSGGNRPKSVVSPPDFLEHTPDSHLTPRLTNSRSHHQFFYNKTWNEKTLNKHNYENVYSEEDVIRSVSIDEMTQSPGSVRSKKRQFLLQMTQSVDDPSRQDSPPTPPARKGVNNEKPLYRSKSCERPKNKDGVRISSDRLQDNLNRLSTNLSERLTFRSPPDTWSNNSFISYDEQMNPSPDQSSITTQSSDDQNQKLSCSVRSSLSLAGKMRGFQQDVQKKISRFRSRSVERISNKRYLNNVNPQEHFKTPLQIPERSFHRSTAVKPSSSFTSYNGPFIGAARALVDCTPSPYDTEALRFKKGDRIEIISMNPNGLWKGKCQGRIGSFKFINVEVLKPERHSYFIVPKSHSISNLNNHPSSSYDRKKTKEERPQTVEELLQRIGLQEYISVFVLNGYEELDNFLEMDESELDYLGIQNDSERTKILNAVDSLLHQNDASYFVIAGEGSDVTLESASPPPPPPSPQRAESSSSSSSMATKPPQKEEFLKQRGSQDHVKDPRDSGCFSASNENLTLTSSGNESDTSSTASSVKYAALVSKYITGGNIDFEAKFNNARSVFEKK